MNRAIMNQQSFMSIQGFQELKNGYLLPALNNEETALASIRELNNLFGSPNGIQIDIAVTAEIREFLRMWRCNSSLHSYSKKLEEILRSLTIFNTLEVPLFIDDYGYKMTISQCEAFVNNNNPANFGNASQGHAHEIITIGRPRKMTYIHRQIGIEEIPIDPQTPIVHVTHSNQAQQIVYTATFVPIAKKNIMEGIWFAPRYQLGDPPRSVYGNWGFETTLAELGVIALQQGEIVYYKKEVNVILYASDTMPQGPLLKPTDNAVKVFRNDPEAYVNVSIFVPSKFLPKQGAIFKTLVRGPYNIDHGPFCVKEKRRVIMQCTECGVPTPTPSIPPDTTVLCPAPSIPPGTTVLCPAPSIPPDTTVLCPAPSIPHDTTVLCPALSIRPDTTVLFPAPSIPPGATPTLVPGHAPSIPPGTTLRMNPGAAQGMVPGPAPGI